MKAGRSQLGQALLADPASIASFSEDDLNFASTLGADFHTRAE